MSLSFFETPKGVKPFNKCLSRFFLFFKFAAKYQSCHPWYPQIATFCFFVFALAILIAIELASPPVLANFTFPNQG